MSEPEKHTETQRLMLEEIEKHTIRFTANDSIDDKLDKIALNLNGKTEGLAKLRRGQTKLMTEISKMPTIEQFESVRVLAEDHQKRFKRFDDLLEDALNFVKKVWEEGKDIMKQAAKKAVILFVSVVLLYFMYKIFAHYYPTIELPKPVPSPS